MLKDKNELKPIYALLFTMPGIPAVYYGSEYGWEGDKKQGDEKLRPVFTLDYKLPGSGMESSMLTDNYRFLKGEDAVKFVSGSIEDLERAEEIIRKYSLTEKCRVYISPVFGKIDPVQIVEFMIERKLNGVRLQLQLHKFIWDPDRGGV